VGGSLVADGSTKPCPACQGSGKCPSCDGRAGETCICYSCDNEHEIECFDCDNTGECYECGAEGRLMKTDFDLEAEGQMNLLQEQP
jgi:hypothetical protein